MPPFGRACCQRAGGLHPADLPARYAEVGVQLVYVEMLPGAKIEGCACSSTATRHRTLRSREALVQGPFHPCSTKLPTFFSGTSKKGTSHLSGVHHTFQWPHEST